MSTKNKKKYWITGILLSLLLAISYMACGCNPFINNEDHPSKRKIDRMVAAQDHNIYIFIHDVEGIQEEPDVLTLYNGKGKVIWEQEIKDLDQPTVYAVSYNKLKYREELTIESKKFGRKTALLPLSDDDDQTLGVGSVPNWATTTDLCVDYYGRDIHTDELEEYDVFSCSTGGEWDYEVWQAGFVKVVVNYKNYEQIEAEKLENISCGVYELEAAPVDSNFVDKRFIAGGSANKYDLSKEYVVYALKAEWPVQGYFNDLNVEPHYNATFEIPSEWTSPRDMRVIIDFEKQTVEFNELDYIW